MNKYSFLILRFAIGASMFGHGLVRLPKLNAFSASMVASFGKSMLPVAVVMPFSYALPFAELFTGLLLLLGLFTKEALIAGGIVMILLIFGTTTVENWDAIPAQLIHVAFFAFLLNYLSYNTVALDNLFKRKG
jgi:thiosulfate dehydrogenase [quinone] large subunit